MTAERVITFTAGPDDAGSRVDLVVGRRDDVGSRAEAQRLIEGGHVTVNGRPVVKRASVAAGDVIRVRPVGTRAVTALSPEDVPLEIRYEDESLLVVDKPAGVVTHPSRGHDTGTLVHGLLGRGIRGGDEGRPGIVHRLDRDTSGLLVVARSDRVHRRLQRMLSDRTIDRRYKALVHGAFPPALSVDRPIGRDRRNRLRMSVSSEAPRDARTNFRRLQEFPRHSLLEARLETGRTHQIRVHLLAAGFPVVGDPVYGRAGDQLGLERQFLHSWRIAFTHPETGVQIEVESELPDDLAGALERAAHARGDSR